MDQFAAVESGRSYTSPDCIQKTPDLFSKVLIDSLRKSENNLVPNISKNKELIVEFRNKEAKKQTPVYICGDEVEQF